MSLPSRDYFDPMLAPIFARDPDLTAAHSLPQTTPEQAEAVRAFTICDTNGDQKIDRPQLAFFLRALGTSGEEIFLGEHGSAGQNPSQSEVNDLPEEVDFPTAWKYYQEHKKDPIDPAVIEDLFSVWDKEGTGQIKFEDLAQCLKIFGRLSNDAFTPEEIAHLHKEAGVEDEDKGGNGMFNYREFLQLMLQSQGAPC